MNFIRPFLEGAINGTPLTARAVLKSDVAVAEEFANAALLSTLSRNPKLGVPDLQKAQNLEA